MRFRDERSVCFHRQATREPRRPRPGIADAVQEDGWYYCTIEKVGEVFGLSSHHARAVLDILDGISPYQVIRTGINEKAAPEGTSRPGAARYVDCHALSLVRAQRSGPHGHRRTYHAP